MDVNIYIWCWWQWQWQWQWGLTKALHCNITPMMMIPFHMKWTINIRLKASHCQSEPSKTKFSKQSLAVCTTLTDTSQHGKHKYQLTKIQVLKWNTHFRTFRFPHHPSTIYNMLDYNQSTTSQWCLPPGGRLPMIQLVWKLIKAMTITPTVKWTFALETFELLSSVFR